MVMCLKENQSNRYPAKLKRCAIYEIRRRMAWKCIRLDDTQIEIMGNMTIDTLQYLQKQD